MPQTIGMDNDLDQALAAVGPRLRELRRQRETTLAGLSAATGISVSTLSRLESGTRRPTLELLLPLAKAHGVTLDELAGAPPPEDPRIGGTGTGSVEFLSLFGTQGERAHLRAGPKA